MRAAPDEGLVGDIGLAHALSRRNQAPRTVTVTVTGPRRRSGVGPSRRAAAPWQ